MLYLIVSIVLILLQIILVVILKHTDADDSFYSAQTNSILYSGYINIIEPSTGINYILINRYTDYSGISVSKLWSNEDYTLLYLQ